MQIANLKSSRVSGEERTAALSEEVEALRTWKDRVGPYTCYTLLTGAQAHASGKVEDVSVLRGLSINVMIDCL